MNSPNQPPIKLIEIRCPLCDSENSVLVCEIEDTTYGISGRFKVARCKCCRHLFLNPRPADESLMDCYPRDYAPHTGRPGHEQIMDVATAPTVHVPSVPPTAEPSTGLEAEAEANLDGDAGSKKVARSPIRKFLRSLPGLLPLMNWLGQEHAIWLPEPPQPGKSRMLEIGCAHGAFLEEARELRWIVDGVEPSQAAATAARGKGLHVHCGDLSSAEIDDHSRDFVAMWMVLEHVPNPRELLSEIASILMPKGELAFSVPNAGSWERKIFGRYWLGYDAPRHLQMFTVPQLRNLLHELGFEDVRVIHQANTRYWWGSIAAWGQINFPHRRWPRRWMGYFRGEPPRSWSWALMIPGKLAALTRNAGRVTIIATRS